MVVLEGGDTALVIMETVLRFSTASGASETSTRRATYVFRKSEAGQWLCVIDNSYGTELLSAEEQPG
jgi:ketosteroid isomerase-like protein